MRAYLGGCLYYLTSEVKSSDFNEMSGNRLLKVVNDSILVMNSLPLWFCLKKRTYLNLFVSCLWTEVLGLLEKPIQPILLAYWKILREESRPVWGRCCLPCWDRNENDMAQRFKDRMRCQFGRVERWSLPQTVLDFEAGRKKSLDSGMCRERNICGSSSWGEHFKRAEEGRRGNRGERFRGLSKAPKRRF